MKFFAHARRMRSEFRLRVKMARPSPRRRRIRRRCYIHVQEPVAVFVRRSIAVAIARVAAAMARDLLFPGRSHELPNLRVPNAALGGGSHALDRIATRRWGTRIVVDPIHYLRIGNVCVNVVGCDYLRAAALVDRNSRTINSGTKLLPLQLFRPGMQIQMLLLE